MKILCTVLFILIGIAGFSQVRTKANVPVIKDKPVTNVPILTDDDLLEIKSNEPNVNDLLDITFTAPRPKVPNAGKEIYNHKGLMDNFSFNKKIGFMVSSPDGNIVSCFYLNTKDGNSLMDAMGVRETQAEAGKEEMAQIMNANKDHYSYIKSSEGDFAMQMSGGSSMVLHDLETGNASALFFKTFKKTGAKRNIGSRNQFPSLEYKGKYEGKEMSMWLADPKDILLDIKFTYSLTGFWGLGYIASPSGKTYLITGIQGDGAGIFMTYMENANFIFSGKGYKPVGEMISGAGAEKNAEMESSLKEMYAKINEEKDPKMKAILLQQAKETEKMMEQMSKSNNDFSKSSDMGDLPGVNDVHNKDYTINYYNLMIASLDAAIRDGELSIIELNKQPSSAEKSKAMKLENCLAACRKAEKARFEKLKSEHIKILETYKNDSDKRDKKIDELMQKDGQPKSCECN